MSKVWRRVCRIWRGLFWIYSAHNPQSILTISLLQHSNFDKFGLMVIQKAIFGYFFCNFDRDCHVHRSYLILERADYWEYKTNDFSGFKFFDLLPKNCLPDGWDRKRDFE